MSFGNSRLDNAYDRWRTGNFGEDQFRGQEEWEIFVERTCASCPCEKWCPVCEKFYDGDDDLFDNPCLVLKYTMEENERINAQMEQDADDFYRNQAEDEMIEQSGVYVSTSANENWFNNYIQFARFIAECEASGCLVINQDFRDSTGLSDDDIKNIINRAQFSYEKMCEQLKYRQDMMSNTDPKNKMLNFNEKIFERDLLMANR